MSEEMAEVADTQTNQYHIRHPLSLSPLEASSTQPSVSVPCRWR